MTDILTIDDLVASLGGTPVLNGVRLSVHRGEIMALVGPSGSGKSTLLRCINRLLEPDKGTITFNGTDITTIAPVELRRQVVYVPQESIMLPGTVYDNVAYGPRLQGDIDDEHIRQCLSDAGLPDSFLPRDAAKLSGGEKQRVALARALALQPGILLLDEPTSGVDPKRVNAVEQRILDFSQSRGLTVLWVTHDMAQAQRVSTRIANLRDGVIQEVNKTSLFEWEGAY